ncbi:uncharacterized protein TNCV_2348381 [Trichonephila clavipes]|uniref:Uncharacterized protein n=1 Tax=Trichonephila clavipes TaxID=2585209 RepID=A0A8X6VPG9_TRICX|nr:uncharacterized protein TNCV_2348381 [Trichonephila clavipes]
MHAKFVESLNALRLNISFVIFSVQIIPWKNKEELIVDFKKLDSEYGAEETEIKEFEQRYFDFELKFHDKIDAIDASRSINISVQNISIPISKEQYNANFRLPKLNIPVFSGKFEDWINFKDLFVTAVHSHTSLGNIQKFQYLKGLVSDEPASLIKHIPLSNESYEEAWGTLIDIYDKEKQIVYALFKTFLDQKGNSQVNMTILRNIVDTSDEVLRGFKALGTEATNRDPLVNSNINVKIRYRKEKTLVC